ncbi:hypothetical protein [Rufibacter sp. XAAS-G3-1]|uniref:DUF922 domain-containing protein n=1 Tax=Rufibacter sp. XAAS-G3-1 TaxID=2729134 RepID=UPI0015E70B28|nr:hypothetical protein [Rufibacter sp. XAAS-G3-1]
MFLITLILFAFNSLQPSCDCWSENIKLKWSDFQGKPDMSVRTSVKSNAEALIATRLVITKKDFNQKIPDFIATSCIIKSESWTVDTTSVELLQHEQLHFDISELFARKIRREFSILRAKKVQDVSEYQMVIDKYKNQRDLLNKKYDRETGNGGVDFVQEEWNLKVLKELNNYKSYSLSSKECSCEISPESEKKKN